MEGSFKNNGLMPKGATAEEGGGGCWALPPAGLSFSAGRGRGPPYARRGGWSETGDSIGAMAGGLDLIFVAGLINKLDGTFVVTPNIKTPADLKGKKIGVQSIGGGVWMFSMLAFDHWGLNPERDNIQFRII